MKHSDPEKKEILTKTLALSGTIIAFAFFLFFSYLQQAQTNNPGTPYNKIDPALHGYMAKNPPYPFEKKYTLPVISITTDEKNLWDPEIGIYVEGNDDNFRQKGMEWERPATLQYYDATQKFQFEIPFGLRMHGGATRKHPQKSFKVITRREYGPRYINYPFFPDHRYTKFDRIILRNSGNDWRSTMIRDVLMHNLMAPFFDSLAGTPSVVYLNGEYWGIYNIREEFDERYFKETYGAKKTRVVVIEPNRDYDGYPDVDIGREGDELHYVEMRDFILQNDMTDPDNYAYIQTKMDTDNYIDYLLIGIFLHKTDWLDHNFAIWRYRTEEYDPSAPEALDGRWRWLHFDMDSCMTERKTPPVLGNDRLYDMIKPDQKKPWIAALYQALLKNEDFKTDFINRYADLVNTRFRKEVILAQIEDAADQIKPELPNHIARWKGTLDKGGKPPFSSVEMWEENLDVLRKFANVRADYTRQHFINNFNLPGLTELNLNTSPGDGGSIRVNSVYYSSFRYKPIYFQGVPIEIEAIPDDGFRFVGWEGDLPPELSNQRSVTVTFDEDVFYLSAVFEEVSEE
ncbi:hypothetical protein GF357_03975 [Candidatus Dojkabacteria bacterium]|nr:hypothetical protein [Candidatus Dojkabacteria bacterium]